MAGTAFISLSWLPYWQTQKDEDKDKLVVVDDIGNVADIDFRWAIPVRRPQNSPARSHRIGTMALASSNDSKTLSKDLAVMASLPNPFNTAVFESRLEEDHLLLLDRDPDVSWIVAQPFKVTGVDEDGVKFSHTPDILAIRNGVREMVDVKPREFVDDPEVQRRRSLMKHMCDKLGWTYSIGSELNPFQRANLRYLRRYRRHPQQFTKTTSVLDTFNSDPRSSSAGIPFTDLAEACGGWAVAAPTILHLLWSGQIRFDWDDTLAEHTLLFTANQTSGAS